MEAPPKYPGLINLKMQKNVFQSQFVHCYWFLILVKYVIIFIVSAFLAQCTSVLDASSCNRKWSVNAFYYSLWHHLDELIKIKFIAIERPRPAAAATWVAIIVHNRDNYLPCRVVKLCRVCRDTEVFLQSVGHVNMAVEAVDTSSTVFEWSNIHNVSD